jgi:solute carrier family 35 protein C2
MSQARYGPGGYPLEETLTLPSHGSISDEEDDIDESIHLASVAEKKRLWFRNAVINTLFISAW